MMYWKVLQLEIDQIYVNIGKSLLIKIILVLQTGPPVK